MAMLVLGRVTIKNAGAKNGSTETELHTTFFLHSVVVFSVLWIIFFGLGRFYPIHCNLDPYEPTRIFLISWYLWLFLVNYSNFFHSNNLSPNCPTTPNTKTTKTTLDPTWGGGSAMGRRHGMTSMGWVGCQSTKVDDPIIEPFPCWDPLDMIP